MAEVRPATIADMDRIYDIVAAAFGPFCIAKLLEDRFGVVAGKTWVEHKAGSVVRMAAKHLDHVIVAEDDGRVVGFASFGCKRDTGSVGNNAVDPAAQGRGIGTALVRHVLGMMRSRGAARFEVVTMAHDAPARRVYEKLGFREVGRTAQYARKKGDNVEQAKVDSNAAEKRSHLSAEGFVLIAESVHYQMTGDDLARAEENLPATPAG